MKKVNFLIIAAIVAGCSVFVGCSSDDDPAATPTIRFTYNGAVQESGTTATVDVGQAVTMIVDYTAAGGIKQIDFKINNQNVTGFPKTSGFTSTTSDEVTVSQTFTEAGTYSVSTMVADKQDPQLSAIFTMVITVNPVTTPLVDDGTFSLIYKGSTQTDGANVNAAHGIKFSSIRSDNVTGVFVIEPSSGNNFVMLADQAAYDAITTKEGLASAYDSGTGVSSFDAKSDAQFSAKFFISKVGSDYFLIKMTSLNFSPGSNTASFASKK